MTHLFLRREHPPLIMEIYTDINIHCTTSLIYALYERLSYGTQIFYDVIL
jgi:hypothetical protein